MSTCLLLFHLCIRGFLSTPLRRLPDPSDLGRVTRFSISNALNCDPLDSGPDLSPPSRAVNRSGAGTGAYLTTGFEKAEFSQISEARAAARRRDLFRAAAGVPVYDAAGSAKSSEAHSKPIAWRVNLSSALLDGYLGSAGHPSFEPLSSEDRHS